MSNSRWADIYKLLEQKGLNVYSPAQHEGECIERYVVIKLGTLQRANDFSSVMYQYDLMLYVPKDEYSSLEPFVEEVKGYMKELYPMIRPMNSQTGSFYDDTVKGHMVSVQYYNYRKLT